MSSPIRNHLLKDVLPGIVTSSELADDTARRALQAVRTHLGMDFAYISQIVGDQSVFREVDTADPEPPVRAGDSMPLVDVYCQHILEGRLPHIMNDTADHPVAAGMPVTQAIPIGSHISVPITLPDGEVYGMFCCLSRAPNRTLHERDMHVMRAFADLTAIQIGRDLDIQRADTEKRSRIQRALDEDAFHIVLQPIIRLRDRSTAGFECLSRFSAEPRRTPDLWFSEAAETGLGAELEIAAIRKALAVLPHLPQELYLAINASPDTFLSGGLREVISDAPAGRLVVEITEHFSVADYDALLASIDSVRRLGVKLAVDDAGAGYSSLRHILDLRPDFIKLDMSLTRNIDSDPARQALVSAMVAFAAQTGSRLIAEGVETEEELETLDELGIEKAQGYLLARPMPLDDALAAISGGRPRAERS